MTKIFAIISKATGVFQTCNGRVAWSKYGNAKRAFNLSRQFHFDTCNFDFDNHYYKIYEIIKLTEIYHRLKGLEK